MRTGFAALLLVMGAWLSAPSSAAASDGIFLVRGAAPADARAAAGSAVREALQQAGWKLAARQLSEREIDWVVACLRNDKPWSCITAIVKDKAIEQIAIISVDPRRAPDGTPLMQVTARIVVGSQDLAYGGEQYCERCNAENIKATAASVATKVLARVYLNSNRTTLDVKSSPTGARVVVDGTVMGTSNLIFDILPGRHAVTLSLRGYREVNRSVEVADGQAESVNVILEAEQAGVASGVASGIPPIVRNSAATERERIIPTWVAPTAMVVGAGALLVGGGFVVADLEQPQGEVQEQYRISGRGIALLAAGVVVAGGGFYLWRRPPMRERTTKTPLSSFSAAPLPGGASAVFVTRF
jgi:hypothetical protein